MSSEKTKNVLIVDDHTFVKAFYKMALKPYDLNLTFAYDGLEAVEKARQTKPDLILMDINLPRMDGVSAAKMIRSDPYLKEVPIVAVSARSPDEYNAKEAGFTQCLKKPITVEQLRDAIGKYLDLE